MSDHFGDSHDLPVQFRADAMSRNKVLVALRDQRISAMPLYTALIQGWCLLVFLVFSGFCNNGWCLINFDA